MKPYNPSILRRLTRSKLQPLLFLRRFPSLSSSAAVADDLFLHSPDDLPSVTNSLFSGANWKNGDVFGSKGEIFGENCDFRVQLLGDCHRLAKEGKLKETRMVLKHMVDQEVEEDLALKQQLELYVKRVHDSDRGVQKLARESIRECQNSISSNGACMNIAVNVGGFSTVYTTNANRMEGRRLKAFWDTLRSVSIEIESIERVKELEEILSRSKKLSQSIPIDCLACMDLDLYTTLLRMIS